MNARMANLRNSELAQIHVAKKQLGLDDDTYRAMLWTVARVKSAGDLDFTGRKRVLDHMRARGFKPKRGTFHRKQRNPEWGWVDQAATDRQPMLRKVIAILRSAGRPREYADAIVQRMFKIERLEFADPDHLHGLIGELMKDQARRGTRNERT
jgi:phage gp16-like protein